jgi:hypothetical protein
MVVFQTRSLSWRNEVEVTNRHVKGGQQSQKNESGGQQQAGKSQQSGGERGGSGNIKNDPERASEAGRNGGRH